MAARPPLLLYLAHARDPQTAAVGPALAAAARRAGWAFDCYYDDLRRGRHFGGGDPAVAPPGVAAGGLVAGGGHIERTVRLGQRYAVAAVGDPDALLWPTLDSLGAESLARDRSPSAIYASVLSRLGLDVPARVLVLDSSPQGPHRIRTAPFLYPALMGGEAALAVDVGSTEEECSALERHGARSFAALGVAPERAARFPRPLDRQETLDVSAGWAGFTLAAARRHAAWGRGVLLGDPDVVAGQLAKACRLALLPLHGRPQVDVIAAGREFIAAGSEPVFGRQWDDRDFFALASAGRGLQVLDPGPPFDAAHLCAQAPAPPAGPAEEPDDAQLEAWAEEGRVLTTVLLWSGMMRELDCLPRLIDLVAETDLRAGLVITAQTLDYGSGEALALLSVPPDRGGVHGRLEPLVGSTGQGVAAEAYMSADVLAHHLGNACASIGSRLPPALRPTGWWPLLDARLVRRLDLPLSRRGRRPVIRARPPLPGSGDEAGAVEEPDGPPAWRGKRPLRSLAGRTLRASRLDALVEDRRPYDGRRPGCLRADVVDAVRRAGLQYMWTKTAFGTPRAQLVTDEFVVLPFTAGSWDGWSPFYTLGDVRGLRRDERRLRARGRPGWLAATVDGPLFALSGEVWQHGSALHALARALAEGGTTGELVNATPRVVARYARILAERESA